MSTDESQRIGASTSAALVEAMAAMAPEGVRLGCRVIQEGDEAHLRPEEQRTITSRDPIARRNSGAGRWLARGLLNELGHPDISVPRGRSGAPIWPAGIVGALAHDAEIAVAAAAPADAVLGLGIDVEPAEPLPDEVATLVITNADSLGLMDRQLVGRLVFAAKEAVYKAVHPLDGVILNYDDIAVDLTASSATTRTDHLARLFFCISPRVVALATIPHLRG